MSDCIFCKIVNKEMSSTIIFQSTNVIAVMDINPVAPFHCLVLPKEHYTSILTIDPGIMVEITSAIQIIAEEHDLEEGFRVVNNCGKYGQQTVDHVHFHVMGKRQFEWPPG